MNIIYDDTNAKFPLLTKNAVDRFNDLIFNLILKDDEGLKTVCLLSTYDHYFKFIKTKSFEISGLKCFWDIDCLLKEKPETIKKYIDNICNDILPSLRMQGLLTYSLIKDKKQTRNYLTSNFNLFPELEKISSGPFDFSNLKYLDNNYKLFLAILAGSYWSKQLEAIPIEKVYSFSKKGNGSISEKGYEKPAFKLPNNINFIKFFEKIDIEIALFAIKSQIGFSNIINHSINLGSKITELMKNFQRNTLVQQ